MTDLPTDTHPEAARAWGDLLRQAPGWRKIEGTCRLSQIACTPVLSGLAEKASGPLLQPGADSVE
jgi:hypothetical protein